MFGRSTYPSEEPISVTNCFFPEVADDIADLFVNVEYDIS